ncbi:MAG: polysaccharide deacetylase family protein [Firmicutes bacterium]|nr:polysaccharide deacetylase family protein [Bacillota bacterium]
MIGARLAGALVVALIGTMAPMAGCSPSAAAKEPPARGSHYWEGRGRGLIFYSVTTRNRHVALTFDDGPSPLFTPQVLDVLREFHAKATFFIIGADAVRFPELIRYMAKQGHEIGNHTQTHPQLEGMTGKEVSDCDRTIESITGIRPTLLRPPGGRMSDHTLFVARKTRHRLILWTWDVDTRDWAQPGTQRIVRLVVNHIDPGDIVLFHDGGGKRNQTVAALRIILDQLTKDGYQFVTVSQLLTEHEASSVTSPRSSDQ